MRREVSSKSLPDTSLQGWHCGLRSYSLSTFMNIRMYLPVSDGMIHHSLEQLPPPARGGLSLFLTLFGLALPPCDFVLYTLTHPNAAASIISAASCAMKAKKAGHASDWPDGCRGMSHNATCNVPLTSWLMALLPFSGWPANFSPHVHLPPPAYFPSGSYQLRQRIIELSGALASLSLALVATYHFLCAADSDLVVDEEHLRAAVIAAWLVAAGACSSVTEHLCMCLPGSGSLPCHVSLAIQIPHTAHNLQARNGRTFSGCTTRWTRHSRSAASPPSFDAETLGCSSFLLETSWCEVRSPLRGHWSLRLTRAQRLINSCATPDHQ